MTTINFKSIYAKCLKELQEKQKQIKKDWPVFENLEQYQFEMLLKVEAEKILLKRYQKTDFRITENNQYIITQLYYYLTGSEHFNGDLNKGILLLGPIGTGKTLIMEAFCKVFNELSDRKKITSITAKELWGKVKALEEGFKYFENRPLNIDDIGKEAKKVKHFGTDICPMVELIGLRYDNGAITFGTGNYYLDTLIKQYGETITDRMKEIFNIFILKGKTLRG